MVVDLTITQGLKLILDTCKLIGFKENNNTLEIYGWSDVIISTRLTLDNYREANINGKSVIHSIPLFKMLQVGDTLRINDNTIITDYFSIINIEYEDLDISNYSMVLDKSSSNKLLYKCISNMYSFDKLTQNNIVFKKNYTLLSNSNVLLKIDTENNIETSAPFILVKQYLNNCSLVEKDNVVYFSNGECCINVGKQELNDIQVPEGLAVKYSDIILKDFNTNTIQYMKDILSSSLCILEDNTAVPKLESSNIKINTSINAKYIINIPVKIIKLIYDLFSSSESISISTKQNIISISSGKLSLIFGGNIIE